MQPISFTFPVPVEATVSGEDNVSPITVLGLVIGEDGTEVVAINDAGKLVYADPAIVTFEVTP